MLRTLLKASLALQLLSLRTELLVWMENWTEYGVPLLKEQISPGPLLVADVKQV